MAAGSDFGIDVILYSNSCSIKFKSFVRSRRCRLTDEPIFYLLLYRYRPNWNRPYLTITKHFYSVMHKSNTETSNTYRLVVKDIRGL